MATIESAVKRPQPESAFIIRRRSVAPGGRLVRCQTLKCGLLGGRLLRFGGRHLAIVEHLDHLQPRFCPAPHVGQSCEPLQVKISLLLDSRMTFQAELLQQRSRLSSIFLGQSVKRIGRWFRRPHTIQGDEDCQRGGDNPRVGSS